MTLTVPKKDPEAFPLHSPAGATPRFHEQCFIGELCNKETDNITGIECECPGYEIERLLLKCNNPDTTNPAHAHTFPTIFPRVQDSRQLFSTPMFMHTNQPRIPSTEIPSSNFTMNSTRAQLASSYSPGRAQFENKTSLVPGFSTSSRNCDAFAATSSAEVISSPTVNTKIAAIFPRVQDSRQLFSTPMFMHTNQPRIPSTEIPSSNFTMNSTRAQLASSYSPGRAQFENKTSLVPGFSTSSRNCDAFAATSSAEVISSPTVNTKIAAIARGNKAAVKRGHNVMVYPAFLILIQKVIIRN